MAKVLNCPKQFKIFVDHFFEFLIVLKHSVVLNHFVRNCHIDSFAFVIALMLIRRGAEAGVF